MAAFWRLIFVVLLALPFSAGAGHAQMATAQLSQMCENAAVEASRRSGVPVSVLKAISLTETGRKIDGTFKPWPWTVNMEGAGHWFDTQDAARAYVFKEFKRGARSFDVGCFQINYKWHNQAFSSIDEMFDPLANALYAAKFLSDLYAEKGSWKAAAGAFHSRTKEHAERYAARFSDLRNRYLTEDGLPHMARPGPTDDIPAIPDIVLAANGPEAQPKPPRQNNYPLLQRKNTARPPLGAAPGASLFAIALTRTEVE
jgi:hypothetical protein